ncbi:hypothetical protein LCGC14_2730180 [marine sediment metagenome]|uniref:Uncharacterized protein n=1 Tax=marine sediment metagenome TaxID=412755 RepID=A0A0F9BGI9_9ZZZZ
MKFPVRICPGCGFDLTNAKPAEIKNPGEVALVGTCPQCSAPYFLVEDSASLLDAPEAGPVAEPTAPPEAVAAPVAEPAPEPAPEPVAEPEPGPSVEPEPEP